MKNEPRILYIASIIICVIFMVVIDKCSYKRGHVNGALLELRKDVPCTPSLIYPDATEYE